MKRRLMHPAHSGVLLGVAGGVVLLFAACNSLTAAKVRQIAPGMTPAQVTGALGQPAHIDHAEITGLTGDVYSYASRRATAQVVFVNGRVLHADFQPGSRQGLPVL